MTCLVLSRLRLNERGGTRRMTGFRVNLVTVLEDRPSHQRSRGSQSPQPFRNPQPNQNLPNSGGGQKAGHRVGPGAGVTPVFAAVTRHDTSFACWSSLKGRSRTLPLRSFGESHYDSQ